LIGYLGPGVILHEVTCSLILASLLDDPAITSASCALVESERTAKTWQVSVADAGSVRRETDGTTLSPLSPAEAELIWRSNYPVASPPGDLWLIRRGTLTRWLDPQSAEGEPLHICTTAVTASRIMPSDGRVAPVAPPATTRSLQVTSLLG